MYRSAIALIGLQVLLLLPAKPLCAEEIEPLEAFDGGHYDLAFASWRGAAEAGEVEAQLGVAGLYATGLGTDQSETEAFQWYRRAALQGHPIAAANLAERYAHGTGVEADPALAFAWLEIARRLGSSWAAEQRERYMAELTQDQLQSALAFADAFQPVPERKAP